MPEIQGRRIHVSFLPSLTAYRGELLSGSSLGAAVFAGTFLRRRRIIMEEQMLRTRHVFGRIFVHEIFHFAWTRLGNPRRKAFEQMVLKEFDRGARGELGWSAESLKLQLTAEDRERRTQRWRDYICESFCDTAGWAFGTATRYPEMTLARRYREVRRRWFVEAFRDRPLSV